MSRLPQRHPRFRSRAPDRLLARTSPDYSSALRETSVIFAAVIGVLVLDERFGALRLAASVLVVAGLVVLTVSR